MSRPIARSVWSPRLLDGLSVALALAAAAAFAWRGTPKIEPRAVSVPPLPPGRDGAARLDDSLAVRLVETNLFSATRSTPRERFVAPGQSPVDAVGSSDPYLTPPAIDTDSELRVVGIVSVNGQRRALVDAGAADSTTRLMDVGDRIAGYRVRRIGADLVEFISPSGARTVRLSRTQSPDSSESPS